MIKLYDHNLLCQYFRLKELNFLGYVTMFYQKNYYRYMDNDDIHMDKK